ncbi:hypothetical protein XCR_2374 [Xanthomonas campestris pv. raphani 756C]|nr:hypothetical protein XCR_2374 [Xanthomonas campestris pv. raphani 756C]
MARPLKSHSPCSAVSVWRSQLAPQLAHRSYGASGQRSEF